LHLVGIDFNIDPFLKVLAINNSEKMNLAEIHQEVEKLLDHYESNQNIPMDILVDVSSETMNVKKRSPEIKHVSSNFSKLRNIAVGIDIQRIIAFSWVADRS